MESINELTILILFRADSVRRIYNLLAVIDYLMQFPNLKIYVREADTVNHHLLDKLLPKYVDYEFIVDRDTILHKTSHFNDMLRNVTTPFIGIWDTDVIPYKSSFNECFDALVDDRASLALPYNGLCFDTSEIIADLYLQNYDFSILDQNKQMMRPLQNHRLTGGAVLMNRKDFISLGAENENYYGWGDDDFDRYIRFMNSGKKIFRSDTPLFHLSHPRGVNSGFSSKVYEHNSKTELSKTINNR